MTRTGNAVGVVAPKRVCACRKQDLPVAEPLGQVGCA